MKSIIGFGTFVVVAWKVITFVLAVLDAANKCGVLEACGVR